MIRGARAPWRNSERESYRVRWGRKKERGDLPGVRELVPLKKKARKKKL